MKLTAVLFWAFTLLPLVSLADDFSLSDGREFKGVTVTRVEPDGIVVMTDDGVEKLPFTLLPKEVQVAYSAMIPKGAPTLQPDKAPADGSAAAPSPESKAPATQPQSTPLPAASQVLPGQSGDGTILDEASRAGQKEVQSRRYLELLIETAGGLLISVVTLVLGWFIASRLLQSRALQQQQKEFDQENLLQFDAAYADFIAIWKLWNHYLEHGEDELPDDHGEYEIPHASRWELLTRAYTAEGIIETVLLKIASSQKLTPEEIETLGRFRQAFQSLGQAIKSNQPLSWNDPEHPDYVVFKRLASCVALMINGENPGFHATELRADAYRQITSNRWERSRSPSETRTPAKAAH